MGKVMWKLMGTSEERDGAVESTVMWFTTSTRA